VRRTPKEIGDAFEAEIAQEFDGEQVPGSGSGKLLKLDRKIRRVFIISCKATDNDTITIKRTWFQEVKRVAKSVMAGGGNVEPALALDIHGEKGIWFPLDVAKQLLTTDELNYIEPDKASKRIARSRESLL